MLKQIRLIALAATVLASGTAEARHPVRHGYTLHQSGSSDYYTARSGHRVHRPVEVSRAPAGASAQCRDSPWSFSESRRGTCSHHGGVARWL